MEVGEAIKMINSGKSPCMDAAKVEMLESGKDVVTEWTPKLARVCTKYKREFLRISRRLVWSPSI